MRRRRLGDESEDAAARSAVPAESDDDAGPSLYDEVEREGLVDRRVDVLVSLALVGVGLVLIVESANIRQGSIDDPIGSGGMPRLLGGFMMVVGVILVARRLLNWRKHEGNLVSSDGGQADEPGFPASYVRAFGFLAGGWGWAFLLTRLGYLIPTFLLAAGGIAAMKVRSPWKVIGIPVIFSVVTFLLFNRVFGIQFPAGPLEQFAMDHIPRVD
jgi:Tripartite tricarboxylate transporter TctB family